MSEIKLINKMEPIVFAVVQGMSEKNAAQCLCDRCRLDIAALALNSLPPKYVATELGEVVTNVDLASSQWQADVMMAVYKAMDVVKKNPRHKPDKS